jgi:transcriptional regulator with XRE-family HTH domain
VQTVRLAHANLLTRTRQMSYIGHMTEVQQELRIPPWTLGWRLQRALDWGKVSTQEMADELEVSRGTISRWCHDQGMPKRIFLKHWALRTGVPFEWLALGVGESAQQDISGHTRRPAGIPAQPATPGHAPVDNEITRLRKRIPLNPALALVLRMAA